MKRLGLALVAVLLLLSSLVGTGQIASAAVDGDDFRGEEFPLNLRWRSCFPEAGPDFECATARVPLDYDRLGSGRIPIDLVRLPATGERIGSLFLNPGGPGGSGVDFVLGAGPILYGPEVRAAYDLVGFDPRGVGRSNPLLCFGTFNAAVSIFPPFAFPTTPDEVKAQRKFGSLLQTQCRNRGGIVQDKMSTGNVARDLEVLRAAVGDESLNFAGYSYGSVIGQVYANLFPDRVGRVMIDGVLNIEDWVGSTTGRSDQVLEQRLQSAPGAEDTFDEFLRLCDENAATCAVAPNAADRVEAIIDSLKEAPLVIVDPSSGEVVFVVTYPDLLGAILGTLYQPAAWTDLSLLLADIELALGLSGPGGLAVASSLEHDIESLEAITGVTLGHRAPKYPNFVEGFPGVACLDTAQPRNFRVWPEAAEASAVDSPHFGQLWSWITSICNRWPGNDADRFVGPFGVETANPLLVLTTRYDPATSFQQAQAAADGLPGSSLVTVEGWGHTTLFTSTCADAIVADFLLNDILPADGTVCDVDLGTPFQDVGPGPAEADGMQARRVLLREATTMLRN